MAQDNVLIVDFTLPRDLYVKVKTFPTFAERAKQIEKKAYDDALRKILERAAKLDW
jgi:hypothetical protein